MRTFPSSSRSPAARRLMRLVWVLLLVVPAALARADKALTPTGQRLLKDLQYLASDELEGRGVGTEGLNKAAEFIRERFAEAGLDVTRVDGGAFQTFTMKTGAELGPQEQNTLQLAGPEGKTIEVQYDRDYRTCAFGGSGRFEAEIVFAGYGIEDEQYNDFAGIEVKGKVALIVRRTPQQGRHGSPFSPRSRHAALTTKLSHAFQKGAVAVLFVSDPYTSRQTLERLEKRLQEAKDNVVEAAEAFEAADPKDEPEVQAARQKLAAAIRRYQAAKKAAGESDPDPLMPFGYGGSPQRRSIPVFHITQKTADKLLKAALGKSLEQLEAQIDEDLKPRSALMAGWKATGQTAVRTVETEVKNVIGVLEGAGPLAQETIVVGAHYDHIGMGGSGSLARGVKAVHNGADDNASGTVALIELARRLASRKEPLPRRVVFIAFTAEESGLIGSAHYCNNPVFPLEKTVAMLNMDMVGRLREGKLTVFGTGTAPLWEKLLREYNGNPGFHLEFKPEGFGPSDHSSFYAKKIPVLHFFTNVHGDYHKPTDDWDKINFEGIEEIVELLEKLVVSTAGTKEPPKYVAIKSRARIARSGARPYFGSIPDFASQGPGYSLSGVAPDSPAARAGLKGGDVIVQLGPHKIGNLEDFDLALRKFQPGQNVEVVVLREGKKVKLKVTLAQPR